MKNYYNNLSFKKAGSILNRALALSAGLLCMSSIAFGQAVQQGVSPMVPPPGGLALDGNLRANTPTAGVGDWMPGAPGSGSGGSVLNGLGVPIDPTTTYHSIDGFVTGDDIFDGGTKKNDNPNFVTWKRGNPS